MKLYHATSKENLPSIQRDGIKRTDHDEWGDTSGNGSDNSTKRCRHPKRKKVANFATEWCSVCGSFRSIETTIRKGDEVWTWGKWMSPKHNAGE